MKNRCTHVVASLPLLLIASAGLAQTQWTNPGGGVWNEILNWDPMNVPASPGESAMIGLAGSYAVTVESISPDIDGLVLSNPAVAVEINGARTLRVGALVNDGVIVVNANNSASAARLSFSADTTITGAGEVLLNRTGATAKLETMPGVTVTNGGSHTISGYGQIDAALVNDGLVRAGVAGKTLLLADQPKTNNSLLEATNGGELSFLTVSLAQGAGGVVRADGGAVVFDSGDSQTIVGGSLETVNGGTMTREFTGTLSLEDVTNRGQLDVQGAGTIAVSGAGLTNDGLVVLNSNNSASAARLRFDETGSLGGTGVLRLNRTGATASLASAGGVTVMQESTHITEGYGEIVAALVNEGLVDANVAGQALRLSGEDKVNNATMRATGDGILLLLGVTITQGPGGVLLAEDGAIGFDIGDSQAITGGTLRTAGAGTLTREATGTTTLTDVTIDGRLDIEGAGTIAVSGAGITNLGLIVANSNNSASAARVRFDTTGVLSGPGVLRLNRVGSTARLDTAPGVSVINAAGHTIDGLGQIHGSLINEGLVRADVAGEELRLVEDTKVNNGTMLATDGGVLAIVNADVLQGPDGVLRASGGDIVFDSGDSQTVTGGALEANSGGTIVREFTGTTTLDGVENRAWLGIQGAGTIAVSEAGIVNRGRIVINSNDSASAAILRVLGSGTIGGDGEIIFARSTGTSYLTAEPGTVATVGPELFVVGAGQFSGDVVMQGTLSPGLPTGPVLATGGTLTLDSSAVLEIGAASAVEFDSIEGSSDLVVGGTLRVTHLSEYVPVPGDVLTIVDLAGSVTGEFDALDLPAVGGGYEWRVRYDTHTVALVMSCAADFNLDGQVNTLDVLAFLNAWTAGDPRADINGDGNINTLDMLAFLNLWSGGCS